MESLIIGLVIYVVTQIYKKSKTNVNVHKLSKDARISSDSRSVTKGANSKVKNRDYRDLSPSLILDMVVENLSPSDKEKVKKHTEKKLKNNNKQKYTDSFEKQIDENSEDLLNEFSKTYDSEKIRKEKLEEIKRQRKYAKDNVYNSSFFEEEVEVSMESLQRELNHSELVNAIIMKEILDKPLALREEGF